MVVTTEEEGLPTVEEEVDPLGSIQAVCLLLFILQQL